LIRPNTYGVPVALCGVPRTLALGALLAGADDELAELEAGAAADEDDELEELLPHPAAASAAAPITAAAATGVRSDLIAWSFGWWVA
jgi:hypothetical protein